MYHAMGLFAAAQDAYRRILALDPDNEAAAYACNMLGLTSASESEPSHSLDSTGAHWARAEAYRAEGNLDAAIVSYGRLLQQNPDHAGVHYVCAVLAGDAPVATLPEHVPRPAPLVIINNFLSRRAHDELLQMTDGLRECFEPSTVGTGERQARNTDIRKSRLIKKIENTKFENWFVRQITDSLSDIRPRLYIDAFDNGLIGSAVNRLLL